MPKTAVRNDKGHAESAQPGFIAFHSFDGQSPKQKENRERRKKGGKQDTVKDGSIVMYPRCHINDSSK